MSLKGSSSCLITFLFILWGISLGLGRIAWAKLSAEEGDLYSRMRQKMVETQIRARNIRNERVLRAMREVPRHEFVPHATLMLSYSDGALPIGYGQTISQPYIVALMTELLDPRPKDKVLEIGTGSGYQAAILSEIVKEVYTIEIVKPLYEIAKTRLEQMGYSNIHVRQGDGTKGWPEAAPFDKIIVTAAGLKIPPALTQQLKEGGKMVMPVGGDEQILVIGERRGAKLKTSESIPVRFVPLVEGTEERRVYGKEGDQKKEKDVG